MKLTNESVAKALGWTKCASPMNPKCKLWFPPKSGDYRSSVPAFTTSLDAITPAIEARGLRWYVGPFGTIYRAQVLTYEGHQLVSQTTKEASTAPLALCAALLAYLKDRP